MLTLSVSAVTNETQIYNKLRPNSKNKTTQTNPSLVALYDIRRENGAGLFYSGSGVFRIGSKQRKVLWGTEVPRSPGTNLGRDLWEGQ